MIELIAQAIPSKNKRAAEKLKMHRKQITLRNKNNWYVTPDK